MPYHHKQNGEWVPLRENGDGDLREIVVLNTVEEAAGELFSHFLHGPAAVGLFAAEGQAAEASVVSRPLLKRKFEHLGIDYSQPGFYDDPNFVRE